MKILVVNAGSSSLKFQLFDMETETVMAKGLVERIGLPSGHLNMKANGQVIDIVDDIPDHVKAASMMLAALTDPEKGAVKSVDEIDAVGHRVLHGGTEFSGSVVINDAVKAAIRKCIPLGPLHNPANLQGIEACEAAMPGKPQVAVFDTAFHQTMPAKAYTYGVPKKYLTELGVRRYGFHGTSHRYVSKRVCDFLGVDQVGKKVIVCHLGNGSSLSAVVDGKCVDTSMGLTPLEGVLMGTRCGSCDPAVVQFIANQEKMTVDEVLNMMNKKSGLLGISGISSDMREIDAACDAGKEDAILAREILIYTIQKYVGSYIAAMGGVDIIAFTGGIGEHGPHIRKAVMDNFKFMGVKINDEVNSVSHSEAVISAPDSSVTVCVIPTDEEVTIARDTRDLCC